MNATARYWTRVAIDCAARGQLRLMWHALMVAHNVHERGYGRVAPARVNAPGGEA